MSTTDTVEGLLAELDDAPQDPDDVVHVVRRPPAFPTVQHYLAYAVEHGVEVSALCGHRWVPTTLSPPDGLDLCSACRRELGRL